jgi:hypothetical protein
MLHNYLHLRCRRHGINCGFVIQRKKHQQIALATVTDDFAFSSPFVVARAQLLKLPNRNRVHQGVLH